MTDSPSTDRLRTLLDQLEQARERLEQVEDSESAVDILQDIANLAKETQVELERARREAASGAP
jgi:exonuclease VII small subunit